MIEKIRKIWNPYLVATHLFRFFPFRLISDKQYLKFFYRAYQNRPLDLKNPKSFNEKLQWLKLYDRKDIYTNLSDKFLVRKYVAEKIGSEYLIPLLGTWKTADEIDFDKLPNRFVLKCNHDSGSVIICKEKSDFNKNQAVRSLNRALKRQYFWKSREWNYKNIKRLIIGEEYINNGYDDELTDYKYFCFDGVPKFIQVDSGRFSKHVRNFYDANWEFINVSYGCPNDSDRKDVKPMQHEKMLELATILSKGFPHVRVDFYVSDGHIFFGELTFHHGGGVMKVEPYEYDLKWGELLRLPIE